MVGRERGVPEPIYLGQPLKLTKVAVWEEAKVRPSSVTLADIGSIRTLVFLPKGPPLPQILKRFSCHWMSVLVRPASSETRAHQLQQQVGNRFGGGKHFVDVLAEKDGRKFLISLKWQQTPGTTEQKVPFEVICLADAVVNHDFEKAYLVLGGEGWKLRSFYTSGGLKDELVNADKVYILTLESFVAKANNSLL